MSDKSIIAIIPIRSKSKSIKDKNIKLLKHKPLVYYSIKAALKSKIFTKIIIATDSNKYITFIKKFINNKDLIFYKRLKKNSTDKASTELVILEILKKMNITENICLIQATSPLVNSDDFKLAYKKFIKRKSDSLISGYLTKKFFWKTKNKNIFPINYNPKTRPMRQQNKGTFVENGAFYFFKNRDFIKKKNRVFGKVGFYLMSKENSIEVDDIQDFIAVSKIIKN